MQRTHEGMGEEHPDESAALGVTRGARGLHICVHGNLLRGMHHFVVTLNDGLLSSSLAVPHTPL